MFPLLQGLATVTSADVSVPLVDDICMIYEEGWQKEGYKTLGMLIFGYTENLGRDTKLQTKLDAAKTFKGKFCFKDLCILFYFFSHFLFFFFSSLQKCTN